MKQCELAITIGSLGMCVLFIIALISNVSTNTYIFSTIAIILAVGLEVYLCKCQSKEVEQNGK